MEKICALTRELCSDMGTFCGHTQHGCEIGVILAWLSQEIKLLPHIDLWTCSFTQSSKEKQGTVLVHLDSTDACLSLVCFFVFDFYVKSFSWRQNGNGTNIKVWIWFWQCCVVFVKQGVHQKIFTGQCSKSFFTLYLIPGLGPFCKAVHALCMWPAVCNDG